jgi:general secretion pathway protein D
MLKRLALVSVMGLLPLYSFSQGLFDDGSTAAQTPAWQQFKLPKKTLGVNFKNASQASVLAFYSKASGVTMVPNPALTAGLTINSGKSLSLPDAFNLLNVTLGQLGYQLQKQGTLLVVTTKQQGGGGGIFDPSKLGDLFNNNRNQTVLKHYPIQYASASAVAKTLNDVFSTDTTNSTNNNPFAQFGRGGGRFNFAQNFGAAAAAGAGANNKGPVVHASADDYSNTVIVNAPQAVQDQIEDLLKSLDKQAQEPYESKVYPLKYASSDDLAPIVQNVLTAQAPTGRGATGQNVDFGSRIAQAARFGSTQASFGTVVSEPKTNQLVVTGTTENQKLVADVIGNLDKPIKFENSAQVIPLSNARADNVAYVINQAFQSKVANTSSSTISNYGNTGNTGTQNINRFQNTGSTAGKLSTPAGLNLTPDPTQGSALNTPTTNAASAVSASTNGSSAAPPPGADPVELAAEQAMVGQALGDPNIDPMALQTNIAVQGGFFNQLNRGGNNNSAAQQSAPIPVRGPNGDMINVHNLTGNVTLIPDINSNSVIVVTNPENMELVKSILDQLDRVPPQVMIQTIIVEATLGKADKFGVEWNYFGGKFGTFGANFGVQAGTTSTTATTPPGFTESITNGNLTAFLQAISQDTKFRVLETPRIFAANNQQAEVNISQSVPYVISSQVDVNGNYNYSYGFENVGVVLDVQPQITANGMVNMAVVQTANELQGYTSFNAPIVNQRIANTDVTVKDGETIVLGGIIGDSKTATINKVPLLGDIPIIGNLFRSTSKSDTRTELLIFLTPHIVLSPEDAAKLRQNTENQLVPTTKKDVETEIKQDKMTPSTPTTGGH